MHTTHSTFSRAVAEVMTRFIGSALSRAASESFTPAPTSISPLEDYPSVDTAQWATFYGRSLQLAGGSVRRAIIQCLRTSYDEGPGGGHREDMLGEYRMLGCAVHVAGGGVSIVRDFGR